MKFGLIQQARFNSATGAYSLVTETEFGDSQITLTDFEREIVEAHFGADQIHRGSVASSRVRAKKQFKLYPSGKLIELNLIYPKFGKDELRLYISTKAGFKPLPNQIWFLFKMAGDLWLGTEDQGAWSIAGRKDNDDERYLEASETAMAGNARAAATLTTGLMYARDPALALKRFELAKYKCEADQSHSLFLSRASGKPFLEAHHVIPVSLAEHFKGRQLDSIDNIVALCPHCHRAVHHAQCDQTIDVLEKLILRRKGILSRFAVSLQDVQRFYSCEEIAR